MTKTRTIPVANSPVPLIVDEADYPLVQGYAWRLTPNGYVSVRLTSGVSPGRETVFPHRLILGLKKGDGLMVNFIDKNPFNVTRSNLLVCTAKESGTRKRKAWNSKSQYKGVRFKSNKWEAAIRIGDKPTYLGRFDTEEEAARAYDKAAAAAFGDFTYLNFPRQSATGN